MYAIVKTGGKQYRVRRGRPSSSSAWPPRPASTVDLQPLLLSSSTTPSSTAMAWPRSPCGREIVGHERGKKIRVFKFKPKRGYKRTAGHRQELTRIRITEISNGS